MNKVKLLIEKYGLPEDLAKEIVRGFKYAKLFEFPDPNKKPTTKKNMEAFEAVRLAEVRLRTKFNGIPKMLYSTLKLNDPLSEQDRIKLKAKGWYHTRPIYLDPVIQIEVTSPIESVTFRINGKNHKITDLAIIDRIQKALTETESQPALNPAHGIKDPFVSYSKKVANLIFEALPNDMMVKEKELTINDIFCVFVKTWKESDVEKIRNYLRNRQR